MGRHSYGLGHVLMNDTHLVASSFFMIPLAPPSHRIMILVPFSLAN